jgi:HSP20 family protein
MTADELKLQQKQEMVQKGEPTKPVKHFIPAVDIYEDDKAITVEAEMPGVSKDDISIDLKDGTLTIKGTIAGISGPPKEFLLKEYETGLYFRRFNVSEKIDQEKIGASTKNGILTISLPKIEPAKPRKIAVTVN